MKMIVEGMTCGYCIQAITKAVQRRDATAEVHVDLGMEEVSVVGRISMDATITAIQEAGYAVVAILELGPEQASGDEAASTASCCETSQS